jgi:hypothetical protein
MEVFGMNTSKVAMMAAVVGCALLTGRMWGQRQSGAQPAAPHLAQAPRFAQAPARYPAASRPINTDAQTPAELTAVLRRSEREKNADALILTYGQAITDPQLARRALALLLSDYYQMRRQAQSAQQASQAIDEILLRMAVLQTAQNQATVQQNQTMIEQNQRIIQLLEQNANQR